MSADPVSQTPLVLGHPATAQWCEAVDAHHAITEEIATNLRTRNMELYEANQSLTAKMERTEQRVEDLEATGVHSCSDTCQRPMCVMRRRAERAERELQGEREALKECARQHVEVCDAALSAFQVIDENRFLVKQQAADDDPVSAREWKRFSDKLDAVHSTIEKLTQAKS